METVLIYLAKSAGLLAVFYAFYFFLLRKDQSFSTNRRFLAGGLFASAILPSVYFTKKVFVDAAVNPFQILEGNFTITEVAVQEPWISPLQILMALYLLGVAAMTVRISIQLISLFRIIYSGRSFRSGRIIYIETSEKMAPFSFLNYVVYNSRLHSETELEHILKHENAHVVQWHSVDVLLANINLIYQWFNPFAWFYLNTLQQNLEYIADGEAVKQVSCKKEYQKSLVKISVNNFNAALTNSFYQSFIKKRIVMLNKNTHPKNNYWKASLVFPLMLAFILLFNVRTVAQVKENNSEAEPETEYQITTEYKIVLDIDKNTTREQLDEHSKTLKQYNVDIQFKDLKYNEDGLLTDISASFLDKNLNTSGSLSRSSEKGITPFTFTYSPENGSGFNSPSQAVQANSLLKLGISPLYIVKGVNYTADELAGKFIRIQGNMEVVENSKAAEKWGNKGRDGALIIAEGIVIENIKSEYKNDNKQSGPEIKLYISVDQEGKPSVMSLNINNNPSKVPTGFVLNIETEGTEPIYIVNGEKVDKVSAGLLKPSEVKHITVLKGENATSVYGRSAKDGAVIISTQPEKNVIVRSLNSNRSVLGEIKDIYNDIISGKKDPLIVIDGEVQKNNFDLRTLSMNMVASMNFIPGDDLKKEYGRKAKDGILNITTRSKAERSSDKFRPVTVYNYSYSESPKMRISANSVGYSTFKIDSTSPNIYIPRTIGQRTRVIRNGNREDHIIYIDSINYNGRDDNASQFITKTSPVTSRFYLNSKNSPLFVVDGKEMPGDFKDGSIDPENIASIVVLKDKTAMEKYGEKGINGVIEITRKKERTSGLVALSNLSVLKANATLEEMEAIKKQLKETSNLDVSFEDIKRNSKGLIKAIKISAKHRNKAASATYQVEEGVPNVYIGLTGDSIIISSNPPNR